MMHLLNPKLTRYLELVSYCTGRGRPPHRRKQVRGQLGFPFFEALGILKGGEDRGVYRGLYRGVYRV